MKRNLINYFNSPLIRNSRKTSAMVLGNVKILNWKVFLFNCKFSEVIVSYGREKHTHSHKHVHTHTDRREYVMKTKSRNLNYFYIYMERFRGVECFACPAVLSVSGPLATAGARNRFTISRRCPENS